jgi:type VI secretion system protein ImpA
MELKGIAGFNEGLGLLDGLVNRYWDEVYPNQPETLIQDRIATLSPLADPRFPARVAKVPLIISKRAGRAFSWSEIQQALAGAKAGNPEAANTEKVILGICKNEISKEEHLTSLGRIESCLQSLVSIEGVFDARFGSRNQVSFRELKAAMLPMKAFFESLTAEDAQAAEGAGAGAASTPERGHVAAVSVPGEISSRDSAISAMGRIIEYFEKNEPSSPVPFLLKRAQRCVGKNFLELVHELTQTQEAFAAILVGAGEAESA